MSILSLLNEHFKTKPQLPDAEDMSLFALMPETEFLFIYTCI